MKRESEMVVRLGARLATQRASGDFKTWEECAFIEQFSLRLEDILTDLGLAAHRPNVRVAGITEQPSKFLFSIYLDPTTCHGPLDTDSNSRISAEQLARLVTATLITHRDTLLVQAVRDEEWERTLNMDLPRDWISRSEFDDLLANAIRHGLNVPNVINAFVALFRGGIYEDELAYHAEAVIATESEPVIRVCAGSLLGLEEGSLSKDVQGRLFFETGVVFPRIEPVLDNHLAKNEFCLELNRLRTLVNYFGERKPTDILADLLRYHAPIYTTTTEIDSALGRLTEAFPMVVFNAIEAYGTSAVLRVLRSLVDEGVDIRDLRTILGAMLETNGNVPARFARHDIVLPYEANLKSEAESGGEKVNIGSYVEYIRIQIRDQICQAYADADRVLHVVLIPATLETRLLQTDHVPLNDAETFDLLSAIRQIVEPKSTSTVLLACSQNRRRLWELIRHEFPRVPVLCEEEISPYVKRYNIGEVMIA